MTEEIKRLKYKDLRMRLTGEIRTDSECHLLKKVLQCPEITFIEKLKGAIFERPEKFIYNGKSYPTLRVAFNQWKADRIEKTG